jgi:hypothetical protein
MTSFVVTPSIDTFMRFGERVRKGNGERPLSFDSGRVVTLVLLDLEIEMLFACVYMCDA